MSALRSHAPVAADFRTWDKAAAQGRFPMTLQKTGEGAM
jgi:hypothetical protein